MRSFGLCKIEAVNALSNRCRTLARDALVLGFLRVARARLASDTACAGALLAVMNWRELDGAETEESAKFAWPGAIKDRWGKWIGENSPLGRNPSREILPEAIRRAKFTAAGNENFSATRTEIGESNPSRLPANPPHLTRTRDAYLPDLLSSPATCSAFSLAPLRS